MGFFTTEDVATLAEIRRIVAILNGHHNDRPGPNAQREHGLRLADLNEALDEWITNGGFLPEAWRR